MRSLLRRLLCCYQQSLPKGRRNRRNSQLDRDDSEVALERGITKRPPSYEAPRAPRLALDRQESQTRQHVDVDHDLGRMQA